MKGLKMKFNLDSALRTAVAAQGYHGYRYIVKAHEVSQPGGQTQSWYRMGLTRPSSRGGRQSLEIMKII